MEVEKEVRYKVSKNQIEKIIERTTSYKEKGEVLDITCGYEGFESLSKYGFICRVRQKGNKITLEVKKYTNDNDCLEECITLDSAAQGVNYLSLIGMSPYLYLKRQREVRKYKDLKIFIDEFDLIGDYVEIEYQDVENSKKELEEFLDIINVEGLPAPKYGDIVKDKLLNDPDFKTLFDDRLNEILGKGSILKR